MKSAIIIVRLLLFVAFAFSLASPSLAAEPVKFIAISVLPYYQAGFSASDQPYVKVVGARDPELRSNDPQVLRNIAALVQSNGEYLTPMTLMVVAIRHYDLGMRDDAVFWFYVAKERYRTMELVLDMNHRGLVQVRAAVSAFSELAGPVINGYAFCDADKQRDARRRATAWAIAHPYAALSVPELPALPGKREENISAVASKLGLELDNELEYLAKPETQAMLKNGREASKADAKYCWAN